MLGRIFVLASLLLLQFTTFASAQTTAAPARIQLTPRQIAAWGPFVALNNTIWSDGKDEVLSFNWGGKPGASMSMTTNGLWGENRIVIVLFDDSNAVVALETQEFRILKDGLEMIRTLERRRCTFRTDEIKCTVETDLGHSEKRMTDYKFALDYTIVYHRTTPEAARALLARHPIKFPDYPWQGFDRVNLNLKGYRFVSEPGGKGPASVAFSSLRDGPVFEFATFDAGGRPLDYHQFKKPANATEYPFSWSSHAVGSGKGTVIKGPVQLGRGGQWIIKTDTGATWYRASSDERYLLARGVIYKRGVGWQEQWRTRYSAIGVFRDVNSWRQGWGALGDMIGPLWKTPNFFENFEWVNRDRILVRLYNLTTQQPLAYCYIDRPKTGADYICNGQEYGRGATRLTYGNVTQTGFTRSGVRYEQKGYTNYQTYSGTGNNAYQRSSWPGLAGKSINYDIGVENDRIDDHNRQVERNRRAAQAAFAQSRQNYYNSPGGQAAFLPGAQAADMARRYPWMSQQDVAAYEANVQRYGNMTVDLSSRGSGGGETIVLEAPKPKPKPVPQSPRTTLHVFCVAWMKQPVGGMYFTGIYGIPGVVRDDLATPRDREQQLTGIQARGRTSVKWDTLLAGRGITGGLCHGSYDRGQLSASRDYMISTTKGIPRGIEYIVAFVP